MEVTSWHWRKVYQYPDPHWGNGRMPQIMDKDFSIVVDLRNPDVQTASGSLYVQGREGTLGADGPRFQLSPGESRSYEIYCGSVWFPAVDVLDVKARMDNGTSLTLLSVDLIIVPGPGMNLKSFPAVARQLAAGMPFNLPLEVVSNAAMRGRVVVGERVIAEADYPAGTSTTSVQVTMPYDDLNTDLYFEALSGGRWVGTSHAPLQVLVGFPMAVVSQFTPPSHFRPGRLLSIPVSVRNEGFHGDIGVAITDQASGQRASSSLQVDPGGRLDATYSQEMPARVLSLVVQPLHLGRGQEWTEDPGGGIESVNPMDCLLHEDYGVVIFGGASPLGITAFAVGEGVKVVNAKWSMGERTVPLLPLSYRGVLLQGQPSETTPTVISYSRLDYLWVEADRGLAIGQSGALVSANSKVYEYSILPFPGMAKNVIGRLFLSATRARPLMIKRG